MMEKMEKMILVELKDIGSTLVKTIGRAKVVIVIATKTIAVFSLSYISFIELLQLRLSLRTPNNW